ncbi:MAG: acyl-CoA dehydrogenase family protein [Elusimicrobiota bacterium]
MDYFLTEEQQMIVDIARRIAQEKIKPIREHYDETEEFPWEILKEIAQADLCGLYIEPEYEGMGAGILSLILAVEEIAKVDGGIALCVAGTALGTLPLVLYGSPEQKKKYLPNIAKGKSLAAFGLTEPMAGSDAGAMKTTAVLKNNAYVLNGTKCFITNAGEAEVYTVFAVTNPTKGIRGLTCFVLEKGMPGFTFGKKEKKMGIRASPTRELIFQDCVVPKENVVGREGQGFIVAMKTLFSSRPGVAAQALGIAGGALDEAIAYARKREQFGQPIINFQAIQHMLADMATEVEAARCLLYFTCKGIDKDMSKVEKFAKESAMSKLFCSDTAMKVTTNAVQIFGGYGYSREYPVEKMMRDAKITQIYEGTNQVQRNEIALALIKEAAAKGL